MGKNLYEELGLKKNATSSEIKSSYLGKGHTINRWKISQKEKI